MILKNNLKGPTCTLLSALISILFQCSDNIEDQLCTQYKANYLKATHKKVTMRSCWTRRHKLNIDRPLTQARCWDRGTFVWKAMLNNHAQKWKILFTTLVTYCSLNRTKPTGSSRLEFWLPLIFSVRNKNLSTRNNNISTHDTRNFTEKDIGTNHKCIWYSTNIQFATYR